MFNLELTEIDGKEAVCISDIHRDEFVFKPFSMVFGEDKENGKMSYIDIPYTIRIGTGTFCFSSYLSDWSNDLDKIRHSIEHYIYTGETVINLCYEDSPAQIIMRRKHVNQWVSEDGSQRRFQEKSFASVVVRPDDFHSREGYHLFGFCEEKQVIREIYEALLNVGRISFFYSKEMKDAWWISPNVFYNSIKSPIIEDYISPRKEKNADKATLRQVYADHILTMYADADAFIWDEENASCGDVDKDDTVEIYFDEKTYNLHVPGLYKWLHDFYAATDFVKGKVGDDFDVDAWHKQGRALAAEMRRQLPPSIDFWYDYPFEDEKNRGKRAQLIYNE
ncbi:MAG: hypothetical protein LUC26_07045 [Prevotella sp.]|nr:hypothetical protein [Prevotella sp.]